MNAFRSAVVPGIRFHEPINARTVTPSEPLGLGQAASYSREAIGPDEHAFVVLLPTGVLSRMAEVRIRHGGSDFALEDAECGPELRAWLAERLEH